ncbi:hypothetical protein A5722_32335 [Mycobacterium vulneris]|nr:hypothetical protein A5722_32335 [Mycolicibacterium vulneris]OCB67825.1 hypothetical protein A5729_06775 [Mycolicibacterium vulneris]
MLVDLGDISRQAVDAHRNIRQVFRDEQSDFLRSPQTERGHQYPSASSQDILSSPYQIRCFVSAIAMLTVTVGRLDDEEVCLCSKSGRDPGRSDGALSAVIDVTGDDHASLACSHDNAGRSQNMPSGKERQRDITHCSRPPACEFLDGLLCLHHLSLAVWWLFMLAWPGCRVGFGAHHPNRVRPNSREQCGSLGCANNLCTALAFKNPWHETGMVSVSVGNHNCINTPAHCVSDTAWPRVAKVSVGSKARIDQDPSVTALNKQGTAADMVIASQRGHLHRLPFREHVDLRSRRAWGCSRLLGLAGGTVDAEQVLEQPGKVSELVSPLPHLGSARAWSLVNHGFVQSLDFLINQNQESPSALRRVSKFVAQAPSATLLSVQRFAQLSVFLMCSR